ncbi:MAG: hypothetical protein V8S08_03325 [Lachnoclostridium sp.]
MRRSYVKPEVYIKNEYTGKCSFTSQGFVEHSEKKIKGLAKEGRIKMELHNIEMWRKKEEEIWM